MISFKTAFKNFKIKAKRLKSEVAVLFLVYKRPDVPWYAKLFVMLIVAYALSPIDLIPDFIPVLGYLDDLVLIPLGIRFAIKMIPPKVMEECRQQAKDVFKDGEPKNWVAGVAIISLWVGIICLIILKVFWVSITFPEAFYLYVLLFIGSFFTAAISGAAGFGGALLLLPLLSRTIGTTLAVYKLQY